VKKKNEDKPPVPEIEIKLVEEKKGKRRSFKTSFNNVSNYG